MVANIMLTTKWFVRNGAFCQFLRERGWQSGKVWQSALLTRTYKLYIWQYPYIFVAKWGYELAKCSPDFLSISLFSPTTLPLCHFAIVCLARLRARNMPHFFVDKIARPVVRLIKVNNSIGG